MRDERNDKRQVSMLTSTMINAPSCHLRQYLGWIRSQGATQECNLASTLDLHAGLDPNTQTYTKDLSYEISDTCGDSRCQFLRGGALQPEDVECSTLRHLCDVKGRFGLCDTGDEAMILQQFLLVAGGEHYPVLIPQASIRRGRRRPDFTCFVPVSAVGTHTSKRPR